MRPILLVDEAQEMNHIVLSELRLLSSTRFDSRSILGVVLVGDERLPDKLRREELVPLGSRLRTRLVLQPHTPPTPAQIERRGGGCGPHRVGPSPPGETEPGNDLALALRRSTASPTSASAKAFGLTCGSGSGSMLTPVF